MHPGAVAWLYKKIQHKEAMHDAFQKKNKEKKYFLDALFMNNLLRCMQFIVTNMVSLSV